MSLFRVKGRSTDGVHVKEYVEAASATEAVTIYLDRVRVDADHVHSVKMLSDKVHSADAE